MRKEATYIGQCKGVFVLSESGRHGNVWILFIFTRLPLSKDHFSAMLSVQGSHRIQKTHKDMVWNPKEAQSCKARCGKQRPNSRNTLTSEHKCLVKESSASLLW